MRCSSLLRAVLDHSEFKAMVASKPSEYYTYTDLKARLIPTTHRVREIEAQLQAKEAENERSLTGTSHTGSSTHIHHYSNSISSAGLDSIAALPLDAGPITSTSQLSQTHSPNGLTKAAPPPVPPASSKPLLPTPVSPTVPSPGSLSSPHRSGRISDSLAARMTALYNAGMEGAGEHAQAESMDTNGSASTNGISKSASWQPRQSPPSAPLALVDSGEKRSSNTNGNGVDSDGNISPAALSPMYHHTSIPPIPKWKQPSQPESLKPNSSYKDQKASLVNPPQADSPSTAIDRADSAPPTMPSSTAAASGPATSGHDLLTASPPHQADMTAPSLVEEHDHTSPTMPSSSEVNGDLSARISSLPTTSDLDNFANRFPDVGQAGFEILPSAPTFRPGERRAFDRGGIPQPFHPAPQSTTSPVLPNGSSILSNAAAMMKDRPRRGSVSSIASNSTGTSTKGGSSNGYTHLQLQQAAATKPPAPAPGPKSPRPPLPPTPASPSLPNLSSTTITAQDLWQYLEPTTSAAVASTSSSSLPSILLIDVRTRKEFANGHIKGKATCIEPFTLSPNSSAYSIENSLVVSPEQEREWFSDRANFDLVVLYDRNTRTLPTKHGSGSGGFIGFRNTHLSGGTGGPMGQGNGFGGAIGTGSTTTSTEAKTLGILLSAIYEFNFSDEGKRLKRSPLVLIGGFEEWIKEIGEKGIQRDVAISSVGQGMKESEYQA